MNLPFDNNNTILLIIGSSSYNKINIEIIKKLKGKICYISTNKTVDSLKEKFTKNNINAENMLFIDTISKTIKKIPEQTEKIYYVNSPGDLNGLSSAIANVDERLFWKIKSKTKRFIKYNS
jgi:hypothetical protein